MAWCKDIILIIGNIAMRIFVGLPAIFCIVTLFFCTAMTRPLTLAPKVSVNEKVIVYTKPKLALPKDPASIALHSLEFPLKRPYKVIGKETVSRYNLVGIKRQAALLHDRMRSLAASIGGDAVINIIADNDKVEGTVVSYEKSISKSA